MTVKGIENIIQGTPEQRIKIASEEFSKTYEHLLGMQDRIIKELFGDKTQFQLTMDERVTLMGIMMTLSTRIAATMLLRWGVVDLSDEKQIHGALNIYHTQMERTALTLAKSFSASVEAEEKPNVH